MTSEGRYSKPVKKVFTQRKVNRWSLMKKLKLLTWKHSEKVLKVSGTDKVIELQEDRSLFSSLMVVYTRRPDTDLEEAIGKYEFAQEVYVCAR